MVILHLQLQTFRAQKYMNIVFIFPSFSAFFIQTIGQCKQFNPTTTLLPICFTKYWDNANVIFFIVVKFQATPNNINLKSPSCLLSKHFLSQCHQCISWSSPKKLQTLLHITVWMASIFIGQWLAWCAIFSSGFDHFKL